MKIGIFETDHFEGAYPKIRICDNGKNKITLIVNSEMETQLQEILGSQTEHFHWITKGNTESKRVFISRLSKILPELNLDLLIFNTIADNFFFYAQLINKIPRTHVMLHVHDVNNIFLPDFTFPPKRLFRFLGKKLLVNRIDSVSVYEEAMVDYLKEAIKIKLPIYWIPGAIYETTSINIPIKADKKSLRIVVPGSIDILRRDYGLVLTVYSQLRETGANVELVLLGAPCGKYGETILKKCISLNEKWGGGLVWYENFVPNSEFDIQMKAADIVLLPVLPSTSIFDGITEIYGITKSSGGMSDMVKWAKPGVVPKDFRYAQRLDSSILSYQNPAELVKILIDLQINKDKMIALQKNALENASYFTIQKLREQLDLFKDQ
jgi:glycosyltransferase involved in cell wall biosynthesis